MEKVSNQKEIVADTQLFATQKKLQKMLGHLDPMNPPVVCPIKDVLATVTDKWSIMIILMLGHHEVLRFNQLKKIIRGVSSKILTERLRRMERDGYIIRKVYAEVPIRVEYQLSDFGISYLDQLLNLMEWIDREAPDIIKRRAKFDQLKPSEGESAASER